MKSRFISVSSIDAITMKVITLAPPLLPRPFRCYAHTYLAETVAEISADGRVVFKLIQKRS